MGCGLEGKKPPGDLSVASRLGGISMPPGARHGPRWGVNHSIHQASIQVVEWPEARRKEGLQVPRSGLISPSSTEEG